MRLALTFHVMLKFFSMCESGDVCSSRSRHGSSALDVKKDTADIARRQGQDLDIWEQVENAYVLLLALGHLTTEASRGCDKVSQDRAVAVGLDEVHPPHIHDVHRQKTWLVKGMFRLGGGNFSFVFASA